MFDRLMHRLRPPEAKASRTAEMKAILAQEAAEPIGNSPEQFAAIVEREIATWKKVVEASCSWTLTTKTPWQVRRHTPIPSPFGVWVVGAKPVKKPWRSEP